MDRNNKMNMTSWVRPNILSLQPYSSARDEFSSDAGIFLDANENPYGKKNRYPDPYQRKLKKALSRRKEIPVENIFIGNGSDEIIDLIFRIFCRPGKDRVIVCPPTYGMYEVSAAIHDIKPIRIPLTSDFELDINKILRQPAKCIFICSPNNPTGNRLKQVDRLLTSFPGIIVVDEAYIDFCNGDSLIGVLAQHPNLILLQTFSKAWALAGARVGVAYAGADIIALMNKVKPPYNVSTLNQKAALKALSRPSKFARRLERILKQRHRLEQELAQLPVVRRIYPSDANFLLTEVTDADKVYRFLVSQKVIVRNRHNVIRNCLRITVGTPKENSLLLQALKTYSDTEDEHRK